MLCVAVEGLRAEQGGKEGVILPVRDQRRLPMGDSGGVAPQAM